MAGLVLTVPASYIQANTIPARATNDSYIVLNDPGTIDSDGPHPQLQPSRLTQRVFANLTLGYLCSQGNAKDGCPSRIDWKTDGMNAKIIASCAKSKISYDIHISPDQVRELLGDVPIPTEYGPQVFRLCLERVLTFIRNHVSAAKLPNAIEIRDGKVYWKLHTREWKSGSISMEEILTQEGDGLRSHQPETVKYGFKVLADNVIAAMRTPGIWDTPSKASTPAPSSARPEVSSKLAALRARTASPAPTARTRAHKIFKVPARANARTASPSHSRDPATPSAPRQGRRQQQTTSARATSVSPAPSLSSVETLPSPASAQSPVTPTTASPTNAFNASLRELLQAQSTYHKLGDTKLAQKLSNEASHRRHFPQALTSHETRRSRESAIHTNINQVQQDMMKEVKIRSAADFRLGTDLKTIQQALGQETTDRTTACEKLLQKLKGERSTRNTRDSAMLTHLGGLQKDLASEIKTRDALGSDVNALQEALSAEAETRQEDVANLTIRDNKLADDIENLRYNLSKLQNSADEANDSKTTIKLQGQVKHLQKQFLKLYADIFSADLPDSVMAQVHALFDFSKQQNLDLAEKMEHLGRAITTIQQQLPSPSY